LLEFIKILAPFLPFISEEIYLNLTASLPIRKDSVHLEDFPLYNPEYRDIKLEEKMKIVQESVTLGRALRNDHKIKTRQPLPELKIFTPTVKEFEEYSHIIAEELNVKCVSLIDEETLNQLIAKRFKPKFSILGPRLGSRMNKFTEIISKMDYDEIMKHSADGLVVIENEEFYLKDDLEIEEVSKFPRLVFKRGANTAVVLNINLTADLIEEGYSREFINKVQNLRKEMQFNITDRIEVKFTADERLTQALGKHAELICREVLAVKFDRVQELPNAPIKINDKIAKIQLQKSTVV
jgi:isoleucyl-tRNA synthetase